MRDLEFNSTRVKVELELEHTCANPLTKHLCKAAGSPLPIAETIQVAVPERPRHAARLHAGGIWSMVSLFCSRTREFKSEEEGC